MTSTRRPSSAGAAVAPAWEASGLASVGLLHEATRPARARATRLGKRVRLEVIVPASGPRGGARQAAGILPISLLALRVAMNRATPIVALALAACAGPGPDPS